MRAASLSLIVMVIGLLTGAVQALEVEKVTEDVYAIVGPLEQRSPENLGNNATFGLVVTPEGTVLMDPGGSWNGAIALEEAIRSVTDQPVRIVINTGGQDHRWLGNGYFKSKGATIIASQAAVDDQNERGSMQLSVLDALIGAEALKGTEPVHADEVFAETHSFTFGGLTFQLAHLGQAHTPGDAYVWVPDKQTVFTGDIVYVERMLGVGDMSNSGTWIEVFEGVAALKPKHLVPGHGHATTLETARAETYDYLVHLREAVRAHLDGGGDMIGSVEVDQSAFKQLHLFDQLAKRNAQAVFAELEFE